MRHTIAFPFFNRVDEVNGAENIPQKGPFVVAANHISHLEHFFIGAEIVRVTDQKVHFIAKPEYWQWPGAQGMAKYLGAIVYDKQNKAACLEPAIEVLKKGGIVAIFPEGTRNFDHDLLEGRTGVARMVLGARVPVLPVGYLGPHTYSFLDTIKHLYWLEKKMTINFGQPLDFSKYFGQEINKPLLREVTTQIMKAIAPLCHKNYPYQ